MRDHLYIAIRPKGAEAFEQHELEDALQTLVLGHYFISYLMDIIPVDSCRANFIRLSLRPLMNTSVAAIEQNLKLPLLNQELLNQIGLYLQLGIPLSTLQNTQETNYE